LGLPFIGTLGLEMGILGEKPQDLKGKSGKGTKDLKEHI
jgi:hypothetical protein